MRNTRELGSEGGYSNYVLGTYRKMTEMERKTPEPMDDMTARMVRVTSGPEKGIRAKRSLRTTGPANGYGSHSAPIAQGSPPFPEAC